MKPRGAARRVEMLTWGQLDAFLHGWRPPLALESGAWRTWEAFHAAYAEVRAELLERIAAGDDALRMPVDAVPFAETTAAEIAAAPTGSVYDAHDHSGLRHQHVYKRGDRHVHEERRIAPPIVLSDGHVFHGEVAPAVEARTEETTT